MAAERKTVKLRHPVADGDGRVVDALNFRRGRFGDLRGISMSFGADRRMPVSFDDLMTIVSRLSGEFPHVIEKLEGEDMSEVMQFALDFYLASLPTGPSGSESSPPA